MKKSDSLFRLLIVSATELEIKPFVTHLGKGDKMDYNATRYQHQPYQIDVLITGVGMVPTAVYTSIFLGLHKYDAVINAGICGSFNRVLQIGDVVNIVSDYLPETGAEDGEHFLSLIDLNLLEQDEFPFTGGKLVNNSVFESSLIESLSVVDGVTVNTVHGNNMKIRQFVGLNKVDVESMEGAAFMFSCKVHKVRFVQIRSISNYIEERNISRWNISLAVKNLNSFLISLLNE